MNKRLQAILNLIQQSESLTSEEKKCLADAVKESDKEITITELKLERTEKVKRTTGILLEETIAELEEKRKSVEAQNRELEIEAALERVRSRSIAMRQSSELGDLSFELVKQVQALGIATWHCAFNIYDEDQESSTEWGSNANGSYPIYKTPREGIFKRYYEIGQRGEALHVEVIGEDRCADHYAYLCTLPDVGDTLVKVRHSGIPFPKSQIDHVAFFKYGYLLFITFEPAPKAHDIFKRFAKVFEQTYTRFLDLQKAEAQAREAQIEVALERVRSRSMAMHHSEELKEIIDAVFKELTTLNLPLTRAAIWIIDDETSSARVWIANPEKDSTLNSFRLQHNDFPNYQRIITAWKQREDFYEYFLSGKEKADWEDYLFSQTELSLLPTEVIEVVRAASYYTMHASIHDFGCLHTTVQESLSKEELEVYQRFGKVFNQSYTRFIDLQKAEHQARESQIQLALERVRARTMAMQKSDELREVVATLYEQLSQLNFDSNACNIIIIDNKTNNQQYWVSGFMQKLYPESYNVPYFEHSYIDVQLQSWKQGEKYTVIEYSGKTKKEFDRQFFSQTEFKNIPQEVQEIIKTFESARLSTAFFTYGALQIIGPSSLSEENAEILQRFARVFDQTYTRFLDLQKAEEQTRLAQIEVSLERVRARAMGMHDSNELSDVLSVLFDQFDVLGISPVYTFLSLVDLDKSKFTYRQTGKGGQRVIAQQVIDLDRMAEWKDLFERMRTGTIDPINCIHYPTESLEKVWEVFDEIYSALPAGSKVYPEDFPDGVYTTQAYCKFGYLGFDHTRAASEEDKDILQRFAKEFTRLYQRFLDLQKAEAQAREAQIEAALEKIRSRTLAMHTPHELGEVVLVIVEKLKELGVVLDANGVILCTYFQNSKNVLHWIVSPDFSFAGSYLLPYFDHPIFKDAWESKMSGADYFSKSFSVEQKNSFFEYAFEHSDYKYFPDEFKQWVFQNDKHSLSFAWQKNSAILIPSHTGIVPGERDKEILKRFSKVFEQAYIRFLDLQKAEAQAKEAKIEAGLERVRSRAMAMQTSEELNALIGTVFTELTKLDLVLTRCVIMTYDQKTNDARWWMANSEAPEQPMNFYVKYHEHPPNLAYLSAWSERTVKWIYPLEGTIKKQWDDFIFSETELKLLPDFVIAGMKAPDRVYLNASFYNSGNLTLASLEPLSDEHFDILIRFAKVFDLTYTRFNDLKQAEAQAREAKIEAALERVRSRTMGMQRSEELLDVASILFQQVKGLGVPQWNCGFNIWEIGDKEFTFYPGTPDGIISPSPCKIPLTEHPVFISFDESRKRGDELFVYEKEGEFQAGHYRYMLSLPGVGDLLQSMLDAGFQLPTFQIDHLANFSYGNLIFITYEDFPEMHDVFKRFAKVFEQTYTRFLDLQKAEAQTREAQIEASLERVRSRAMAMHKSDDLTSAVAVVFDELEKLDLGMSRCGIGIHNKEKRSSDVWTTSKPEGQNTVHVSGDESMDVHHLLQKAFDAWLKQEDLSYVLQGEDLAAYYRALQHTNFRLQESEDMVANAETLQQHYYVTTFPAGALFAFRENPFTDEAKNVMKRFANVFNLTYKRFQDIQKAEAQAREATIEASLEKVRGKAMSMHNSNDLTATAGLVFTELRKLGINSFRSGVGLLTKENRNVKLYSATSSEEGGSFSVVGWAVLDHHPVLSKTYDSWVNNEDYYPVLKGEMVKSYYAQVVATFTVPVEQSDGYEQHGYFLPFSEGLFYGWSEKAYTEPEIKILHRFRGIVDLTFRRYMELEKSESIAKEAIRQASLDRVRAEIASMRTTNDLDRITPLIWKELNVLSIPFVRCGVFIMDESQRQMHSFLSTPEGEAIAAFHLPYETSGNVTEILSHWMNKEMYISHWDESAFSDLGEQLVKQGAMPSKDVYMRTIPSEGIHLHCLPFLQGMLYVGNTSQLKEDDIHLIQSVADAFSTAYARYEDFNKLESAKAQIERTLTDLKQTQNLLVQSEKMASLGELTAGIAHEIQNPLNFVNNFSEVSNELLEEMKEEIAKGNYNEVEAITNNIKQNLEKILHHGKRADGIVKGMLQHSRSSTGVKEPTDINALADEYLRLAYHGFRAKDKSFNASTTTDLDKSIGKINVVPQDIGRVVLNLITNAFFAVSEKQKQAGAEYRPTVSLSTKRGENCVSISVKDNGNGIPEHIREKIFQPFFTTKPTGQGTGLGLSLTYDILKAHGGEITLETQEGEGAEFIINLPYRYQ